MKTGMSGTVRLAPAPCRVPGAGERKKRGAAGVGWVLAVLLLCTAVGCGGDPQALAIQDGLNAANQATTKLNEVKGHVKAAIDAANSSKKPITSADVNLGKAKVVLSLPGGEEPLRKLGEELQSIRNYADMHKEKTTEAYRAELAERYRGKILDAVAALSKADHDLQGTLLEAEKEGIADDNGKAELKAISDLVKAGREAFGVLTKQR